MSGSVTISTSGVPPRLKSTTLDDGAVDAARLAEVDELRRVLLEVDAVQPHVAHAARPGTAGSSYWEIWYAFGLSG